MKILLTAAATAAAIVTATPAAAESWYVATTGGSGVDETVYLIDMDGIRREGNSVWFETQTLYSSQSDTRDFTRSHTSRIGNCDLMASYIARNRYYFDGDMLDDDTQPQPIVRHSSGSIMEYALQVACGMEEPEEGPLSAMEMVQVRAL